MEYSKSLIFSLVFCVFIINGVESIGIQLQATPSEGILGPTSVQLKCSFTTVTGEFVTGLNIKAKSKTDGQFKTIARFNTPTVPLNASLTPDGNYLTDRVTLTNPTSSLFFALIQFSELACEDETEYMCQVAYIGTSGSTNADSGVANISVKGNPEQPDSNPSYVPSAGIEEGNNVVFTCTGNVGKPEGKFRWVRYRRNSNGITIQETPYDSETTTAAVMPGTCTSNGTSSLTLKMEQLDNNAVVRCQVVYQNVPQGSLYKQTDGINVYYSVRNVGVTKSPSNPTFAEGAGPITLTCTSDGNPALINTDYTWHKESNTSVVLGTGTTYIINNVVVNETDNYICVAQNSFNGQTFNMNNSIHIQIDFTTTTSTTTPSTPAESISTAAPRLPPTEDGLGTGAIAGIAVGIAVLVIIIIIIVIIVLRRSNRGKDDSIDEPPEKPRNNLSFVDKKDALGDKNGPFNNHNIHYADLNFDDRPRSRKPLQLSQDSDLDHTPYAEVMMPRV
ncbi:uncharacterized protein LOC134720850 [Mytilus trossulus]|uniref:uncharacterized protein LOC134720850 n=1 Tax=Mytilus trossulus TaxID=6551 RepID=UPI003006BC4F